MGYDRGRGEQVEHAQGILRAVGRDQCNRKLQAPALLVKKYTKQRTVIHTDEQFDAVVKATKLVGKETNAFIRWASVNTARYVLNQPHAYVRAQPNGYDRSQPPPQKMNYVPHWEDSYQQMTSVEPV